MKLNVEKIKELKLERGWSQNELARQLGLHTTTFSAIMTHKRGIGLKTMERILNFFTEETFATLFIRDK